MSGWPMIKLGSVLHVCIDAIPSSALAHVNLAGIYGFGRGLFKRGEVSPQETTYKVFHCLHANDFVISMPKAWEGAITRISEEFDGWFLSPVFPTFRADETKISTLFLHWYCKREAVWRELHEKSKGMGARRESVSPGRFLDLIIPLPPLSEQQAIVTRLDALADRIRQVEEHLAAAEAKAEHLLALRFQEAIADAPYKSMQDVAPLVRREVRVELEASYPELGIRSFGKGTFHKPALTGSDAGSKRLFRIEQGDLLFSNVFAWEGAIAIVQQEDHGRFGSHRFITCVARKDAAVASFLRYYLLSPAGMEKIGEASPGGAGRNRTLGLKKLMAIQVPTPPLPVQQSFVQLQKHVTELKTRHDAIRVTLSTLMPAMLERIFGEQAQTSVEAAAQPAIRPQPQSRAILSLFPDANRLRSKAAVASYITMRCHGNDFGKVKLAKCYYLLHERLNMRLTDEFRREAAGPWDREQDEFLNYASQQGWLELPPEKHLPANAAKGERAFKAVLRGKELQHGADEAAKLFGANRAVADTLLREMKKMHWELLELWATALDAAKALRTQGEVVTAQAVLHFISSVPKWVEHKLEKKQQYYTEQSIENALASLRKWQLLVE